MTCALPPQLEDRELLAYLDGEAGHQVIAHLERCPHCRERADRLARLQSRITSELYRIACPSPLELGEYHLGVLSRDQAAGVARHLAGCPHCSREVAQLEGYLGELAPDLAFSPLERIKVLVAELLRGAEGIGWSGGPALAPALVGVRGEEAGPWVYQAGEVQIAIEIQDDAAQPGRKMLLGLLTGMEPRGLVGHLWLAEQRVAEVPVDELGNLIVGNLVPGRYELILSGPEVEIHIRELEVGTG